jgi:hypothetical protein
VFRYHSHINSLVIRVLGSYHGDMGLTELRINVPLLSSVHNAMLTYSSSSIIKDVAVASVCSCMCPCVWLLSKRQTLYEHDDFENNVNYCFRNSVPSITPTCTCPTSGKLTSQCRARRFCVVIDIHGIC